MLEIIAVIAIVIAIAVVAILILASAKPDIFRVQRTASIAAPPEKIFPLINEFDNWISWSPYEKRDPDMKRIRSGPSGGKGAVYEWNGNNNVGAGRMEILDTSPPSKIVIKLDFFRPFKGHNTAEFTLEPKDGATNVTTNVTWAMFGPNKCIGRVMGIFINMDKMIGKDFEAGLANMKTLTER
jgi:uncharacterized protein YndB with AHSA1/START domain